MSHIQADIIQIQNVENLHILTLQSAQNTLSVMSLELNPKIQIGSRVTLTVKPTAVAIAKHSSKDLSFSNQLPSKILSLELGKLLCNLVVAFESYQIESIISTSEAQRMQLQAGMDIVTLINSSDLAIEEIL